MAKRRLSSTIDTITVDRHPPAAVAARKVKSKPRFKLAAAIIADTMTSKPALAALSAPSAPTSTAAASTGSKQVRMVALLRRAEGATIAELMAATGWMSHSVRGALSAVVKRKLGLAIESDMEDDRGRVYRIAPPPPVTKPTPGRRKAKTSAPSAVAAA